MKTVEFLIFSLFLALTTAQMGCISDGCTRTSCQNGGNCESGACRCPNGYYGTNCEKNDGCRIAAYSTQSNTTPPENQTLTYDGKGRLVAIASPAFTASFTYTSGQIEEVITYSGSADYRKNTYLLNSKGYPTVLYSENNNGGISRDTVEYDYDANDYIIAYFNANYLRTITYANGNRITEINKQNGVVEYTANYEYYTNRIQTNTYNGQYVPQLFGTREKNMLKKYTENYPNGKQVVVNYAYEYDGNGNVTQETVLKTYYNSAGNITSTNTLTSNYSINCLQP